jgi:hypothetical protein
VKVYLAVAIPKMTDFQSTADILDVLKLTGVHVFTSVILFQLTIV